MLLFPLKYDFVFIYIKGDGTREKQRLKQARYSPLRKSNKGKSISR